MQFEEGEAGLADVQVESPPVAKLDVVASFREPTAKSESSPPVFHPLAYRGVVAEWPIDLREKWGRRANELEEGGLSWRDAETQAFVEVWNLARARQAPARPQPSADLVPAGES